MAPEWFDELFIVVASACLLLQAFLLVRLLWRLGTGTPIRNLGQWAVDASSWLRRRVMGEGDRDEDSKLTELIQKEVDATRVTYARRVLICCVALMSPSLIAGLRLMVLALPQPYPWTHSLVLLLGYATISALVAYPPLMKAGRLGLWHFVLTLLSVSGFLLRIEHNPDAADAWHSFLLLGGVFIGLINLDIRVSFITNLLTLLSVLYVYGQAQKDESRLQAAIIREVSLFAAKVTVLFFWERAVRQRTRQQLRVQSARGHKSAVMSLLGMVCDAVAELDGELNLAEHVPWLACALFVRDNKSLQGEPLRRFICGKEEQDLVESSLRGKQKEPDAKAGLLHTELLDAWGRSMQVQLYHVPFVGLDDEVRHLIGFKEAANEQPPAAGATASAVGHASNEEEGGSMGLATIPEQPVPPGGAATGLLAAAAGRRPRRPRLARSGRRGAADCVGADVVASPELAITFHSSAFRARYGSPATMFEVLPEPAEFLEWINRVADEVVIGTRPPRVEEFGHITVRGDGAAGSGPDHTVLLQANFPDPSRGPSCGGGGAGAAPADRAGYEVSLRFARPRMADSGPFASAASQAGARTSL